MKRLFCKLQIVSLLFHNNHALSLVSDRADRTRNRLSQAFSSPSGKLTLQPELVIPEPSDPTAILLLTNAVQNLSEKIRNCKTNAAFLSGSLEALQTFTAEQEQAAGSFPGPVPVVYCGSEDISAVADAGADGILVDVCAGNEVKSIAELASDEEWIHTCRAALDCGLQPIPEVTLGAETASVWTKQDVENMVTTITEVTGTEPVSVVLTVNPVRQEEEKEEEEPVPLPPVPKALTKKVSVLGSVRSTAGDNRLSSECNRMKEAGYTGTFLRSDCVPGFRMQPDLFVVSKFWEACISDLKSTRSKSFSFRSKNNMEQSDASKWANYRKSVLDSGALGDPEDSYSIVDEAAGEYKGFA
jgi:hypothetical protein